MNENTVEYEFPFIEVDFLNLYHFYFFKQENMNAYAPGIMLV